MGGFSVAFCRGVIVLFIPPWYNEIGDFGPLTAPAALSEPGLQAVAEILQKRRLHFILTMYNHANAGGMTMRYREFGGKQVSVLALGSTDFGGTISASQAADFMDAYRALGGNFIDTAHVYGDFITWKGGESEKVIGRWLDGQDRDAIFLSTKGGHPRHDTMTVGRLSREEIMDDARRSLDNLHTGCVDIYWLHRDDVSRPVGDILDTLNALLDAGMTRMIGVSNWSPARIREAFAYAEAHGLTGPAANQPQCSLARQMIVEDPTLYQMDDAMWRLHQEMNLPLIPFSSQAKGFFSKLDALGRDGLPEKALRRFYSPENLAVYERILKVREQTGLSVGAIALAWLTCQPFPVFPLCGVSRMEQVEALREAGDAVITPEQRDYLRTLG